VRSNSGFNEGVCLFLYEKDEKLLHTMCIKLHGHDVYINGVLLGTLVRALPGSVVWSHLARHAGLEDWWSHAHSHPLFCKLATARILNH
jgi:hypothetical protein